MGNFFKSIFGGNNNNNSSSGSSAPAAKKLFSPEQVQKVTKDYTTQGNAKWQQIMAGMQAGGGTGGDLTGAIENQAKSLGTQLGELTDQSGYGNDGMSQLSNILKNLEGGIGAKYNVYS